MKHSILIALTLYGAAMADLPPLPFTPYPPNDDPYVWMASSIPMQAAVCDIAGVGNVTENSGSFYQYR